MRITLSEAVKYAAAGLGGNAAATKAVLGSGTATNWKPEWDDKVKASNKGQDDAAVKQAWVDGDLDALARKAAQGIWVPLEIVIARPFIEHLMMSAVLTVAGRDTGATLFGPAGARRRLSGPCTHFPSPQRSHPSSRLRSQTCRSRRTRRSRRSRAT